MRRRFATLDVFTERRFAGNPLAVVLDPQGLDTAAMQAIAREFNHPETVFVFPPRDGAHRAALRIFTPAAELPFAGHPTVGTAVLLGRLDGGAARDLVLEEAIGPVRCRTAMVDADCGRASFDIPRLPAEAGTAPATDAIAAALGLDQGDIGFGDFVPAAWSAGNALCFVPIRRSRRSRAPGRTWAASTGPSRSAAARSHTSIAARSARQAATFMPACSRPAWASRKIRRPARPRRRSPACWRRKDATRTAPTP